MKAVLATQVGTLHRHHFLNHDITGSPKYSRKPDQLTLARVHSIYCVVHLVIRTLYVANKMS